MRATRITRDATGRVLGDDACFGCNGGGKFYSGGAVVNGAYTGTVGRCYRCQGKGYQTTDDARRNRYYDTHVRRIRA